MSAESLRTKDEDQQGQEAIERGRDCDGDDDARIQHDGHRGIAAEGGAEFAVFDMEHTGWSMETVRMLMATARSADIVPIVRVPSLQYHFIARVLDVGAMGVVVPFVADEEGARLIVSHAKYPPEGRRGVAFGVAHDDYRGGNLISKMHRANDEIMLIAQIENADGVEHAERIASVDGIDALWIGQFDLTTSLGIPGQMQHTLFKDATRRVVEACRQHNKTAGARRDWMPIPSQAARRRDFECSSTLRICGSTSKVCVAALMSCEVHSGRKTPILRHGRSLARPCRLRPRPQTPDGYRSDLAMYSLSLPRSALKRRIPSASFSVAMASSLSIHRNVFSSRWIFSSF